MVCVQSIVASQDPGLYYHVGVRLENSQINKYESSTFPLCDWTCIRHYNKPYPFSFADYFKELLVDSKKEFHAMFKRTYGAIYEQNSYVFSDLFVELETYYTWGQVNLSKVLDEFFNKLYQKMFTVLNSQFSYDDK